MRPLFVIYVAMLILSIGVFFIANKFPGKEYGVASPSFFPQILAVFLFVLSILGMIELWRQGKPNKFEKLRVSKEVLMSMGVALAYIQVIYLIGYFPSTFIFVFVIMLLVRGSSLKIGYVLFHSFILTGLSFVLFEVMLNAYLPKGIWFE